jgi:hypothetical protein
MSRYSRKQFLVFTVLIALVVVLANGELALAQQRRPPAIGRFAVVADERLSAVRDAPNIYAKLLQRLSRGRMVSIIAARKSADDLTFFRIAITRRTRGWVQSEALIVPGRPGDDDRMFRMIETGDEFERVARARIFIDFFPHSRLRPSVLMLYGEAAEEAAGKFSRDAGRRLEQREMEANGAPVFSYFLNFNELDRYNRHGATFTFDRATKHYHYEGWAWREIVRRYPDNSEAGEARRRLDAIKVIQKN